MNKLYIYLSSFFLFIVITVAFFALPIFIMPDSTIYMKNAEYIAGISELWNAMRGPVFPLLIAASNALFGYSYMGLFVGLYLQFILFIAAFSYLIYLLGYFKKGLFYRIGFIFFILFIAVFNPHTFAYAHQVLTEFTALTLVTIMLILLLLAKKITKNNSQLFIARATVFVLFTVLFYALKETYFTIPVLAFVSYTALQLLAKFELKKLLCSVLVVFIMFGSIMTYTALYNTSYNPLIQNTGGDVSGFAGSFIIDGLRYFKPDWPVQYGINSKITVLANDYESSLQTFDFTFEPNIQNNISYFFSCFATSPERVLKGYYDNYQIIAGAKKQLRLTGKTLAFTGVSEGLRLDTFYESIYYIDRYHDLNENSFLLSENIVSQQDIIDKQFNISSNSSLVSKLLYKTIYPQIAYYFTGFVMAFALPLLLVFVFLYYYKPKSLHVKQFYCTNIYLLLNIFSNISFLAVLGQSVDRYAFALNIYILIFWANMFFYFVNIKEKTK